MIDLQVTPHERVVRRRQPCLVTTWLKPQLTEGGWANVETAFAESESAHGMWNTLNASLRAAGIPTMSRWTVTQHYFKHCGCFDA